MKGLKKIALCSAVALAPFAANADLKALDDSAMSSVTGQAGVTIDLSANVSIGEIAYKDGGFLALSGVTLAGGAFGPDLDDIRLTIDVAGDGAGDLGITDRATSKLSAATTGTLNSTDVAVTDGDLVIGLRSQSGDPVDFGLGVEQIALAQSTGPVGSLRSPGNPGDGTVLVSNLNLDGFIGPVDIVVDGQSNNLNINAFFSAEGNIDLPFIGTSFDLKLHNARGDDTVIVGANPLGGVFSFAHAQVDVGVTKDYVDQADGTTVIGDVLSVNVTDFSGDLDLTNINTGGAENIGDLYMTDMVITADMKIYGH